MPLSDLHRSYDGPIPPAEIAASLHGPAAWEVQGYRATAASCWRAAFMMLRAAKEWRRLGNHAQAGRCIETALVERRNAKFYRAQAELARARAVEWGRRFMKEAV